jgi:hypothetical protein
VKRTREGARLGWADEERNTQWRAIDAQNVCPRQGQGTCRLPSWPEAGSHYRDRREVFFYYKVWAKQARKGLPQ